MYVSLRRSLLTAAPLTALMGAVVAAMTLAPAGGQAASAAPGGIGIHGVQVYKVKYHDKVVSFDAYESKLAPAAVAKGQRPNLIVDRTAVSRGYMVAFDSPAESARYERQAGFKPTIKAPSTAHDPTRDIAASSNTLGNTKVALASCPLPGGRVNYLYTGYSCGGRALGVANSETVNQLSVWGFDNTTSSIALGGCVSMLYVYNSDYEKGNSTSFHGGDVYTMASGFNDSISSYISQPAAC